MLSSVQRQTNVGFAMTINDPGNAALPITVGSTHRDMPHTYGVSYFSSKGPTGDGRAKPDLIAPGERITSCAAGRALADAGGSPRPGRLRRRQRDQHGRAARVRRDRGVPVHPPGIRRAARARSRTSSPARRRLSAANGTSKAMVSST